MAQVVEERVYLVRVDGADQAKRAFDTVSGSADQAGSRLTGIGRSGGGAMSMIIGGAGKAGGALTMIGAAALKVGSQIVMAIGQAAVNAIKAAVSAAIGLAQRLAAVGIAVGGLLLKASIDAAASRDSQMRGLTALMGSADRAAAHFEELRQVALLPGATLDQALSFSVRLQAVGLSAGDATSAVREFANAVALSGGSAENLDRVSLALSQIVGKGKVSAEEINQIAEAVPQVRAVLKDLFGNTDTQAIQKQLDEAGVSAEQFVRMLTEGFAKLPRATGGLENALTNLKAGFKELLVAFGEGFTGAEGIELVDALGGALAKLEPIARAAGAAVAKLLPALTAWIERMTTPEMIEKMALAVMNFFDHLITGGQKAIVAVKAIAAILPILRDVIVQAVEDARPWLKNLSDMFAAVGRQIAANFGLLKAALSGDIGQMREALKEFFRAASGQFATAFKAIRTPAPDMTRTQQGLQRMGAVIKGVREEWRRLDVEGAGRAESNRRQAAALGQLVREAQDATKAISAQTDATQEAATATDAFAKALANAVEPAEAAAAAFAVLAGQYEHLTAEAKAAGMALAPTVQKDLMDLAGASAAVPLAEQARQAAAAKVIDPQLRDVIERAGQAAEAQVDRDARARGERLLPAERQQRIAERQRQIVAGTEWRDAAAQQKLIQFDAAIEAAAAKEKEYREQAKRAESAAQRRRIEGLAEAMKATTEGLRQDKRASQQALAAQRQRYEEGIKGAVAAMDAEIALGDLRVEQAKRVQAAQREIVEWLSRSPSERLADWRKWQAQIQQDLKTAATASDPATRAFAQSRADAMTAMLNALAARQGGAVSANSALPGGGQRIAPSWMTIPKDLLPAAAAAAVTALDRAEAAREPQRVRIEARGEEQRERERSPLTDRLTASVLGNLGADSDAILSQAYIMGNAIRPVAQDMASTIAQAVAGELQRVGPEVRRQIRDLLNRQAASERDT